MRKPTHSINQCSGNDAGWPWLSSATAHGKGVSGTEKEHGLEVAAYSPRLKRIGIQNWRRASTVAGMPAPGTFDAQRSVAKGIAASLASSASSGTGSAGADSVRSCPGNSCDLRARNPRLHDGVEANCTRAARRLRRPRSARPSPLPDGPSTPPSAGGRLGLPHARQSRRRGRDPLLDHLGGPNVLDDTWRRARFVVLSRTFTRVAALA